MDGTGYFVCRCRILDPLYVPVLILAVYLQPDQWLVSMLLVTSQKKLATLSTSSPVPALPYPPLTSNCSVIAARGMLTTATLTGTMGFLITILFLFCTPDLDTLFAINAPQPFVQIYAMALGKGPSVFMTIIAVIGMIMVYPLPYTYRSTVDTAPFCAVYIHYNPRCLTSHLRRGP